eukprot:gene10535-12465_t
MDKISVSVRIRPLNRDEECSGESWRVSDNTIIYKASSSQNAISYCLDNVFGPEADTTTVYEKTAKDTVLSVIQGFNGTLFAYGQTSSGKTHTMRGATGEGIVPRSVRDIFAKIETVAGREYLLRVSYMEIYNEQIRDLLRPSKCQLQVHEDPYRGVYVSGLHEEIVSSADQVLQLMESGELNRHVGETNMNLRSSRSHTIFRMVVESREYVPAADADAQDQTCDAVMVSTLNLVDLAGSERVRKTGAEGARLKEGVHINKSLSVLGTVINKLSEGGDKLGYIPYRDSKLTRILQPALGGNARTSVIACITPSSLHADETKGTLQFACRAKCVTNSACQNEVISDTAIMKRQTFEIAELRQKLREVNEGYEEEKQQNQQKILQLSEEHCEKVKRQNEMQALQAKIENLSRMLLIGISDPNAQQDGKYAPSPTKNKESRRVTWCPDVRRRKGPPIPLQDLSNQQMDFKSCETSCRDLSTTDKRDFGLPPPFGNLNSSFEAEEDYASENRARPPQQPVPAIEEQLDMWEEAESTSEMRAEAPRQAMAAIKKQADLWAVAESASKRKSELLKNSVHALQEDLASWTEPESESEIQVEMLQQQIQSLTEQLQQAETHISSLEDKVIPQEVPLQ